MTEYGLRATIDGVETYVAQISGGGRIRLCQHYLNDEPCLWWTNPPVNVEWEVFDASAGEMHRQTYHDRETAAAVAKNLHRAAT